MSIDLESQGQMCLLRRADWRTMITLPHGHRLVTLYEAIPWHELMEKAKPILYDEQGISPHLGRELNLRAHLGAYILQTVHGCTLRVLHNVGAVPLGAGRIDGRRRWFDITCLHGYFVGS
jgi:hypothetical protein